MTAGCQPWALCYNSVKNKVYCANHWSNNVTVIDGSSNRVIATVAAGRRPRALCYNPTNDKVYCANLDDGLTVTVIDGANDSVIATVAAGWDLEACGLGYNSTNNKVYCANYNCNTVKVIDGAADSVIANVPALSAYALCYNPANNKVYCADNYHKGVTVFDGATDSVLVTLRAGDHPCALCCDSTNNKVYCANQGYGNRLDSTVTVIDGATDRVVATIGVGVRPTDLAWNPVQNRVYIANYASSSISVLRDTGSIVGVEEGFRPQPASAKPLPSIVRGVLMLGAVDSRQNTAYRAEMLNVTGRKVMDLRSGANDVRALAPGVYFIRSRPSAVSRQPLTVTKVVVTR